MLTTHRLCETNEITRKHQTKSIFKVIILTTFLVTLTACGSQYIWVNSNSPQTDFAVDQYECTSLANRSIPIFDSSNYMPPPSINEGPRPNLECNNPNLSGVNCFSGTGQSAIPPSDEQLLGQTHYQQFVTQCLEKRGWRKKEK
jgi:hypothetical protein